MSDSYNGTEQHLGTIFRLSDAETRSISAENKTGEKGKAGMATDGAWANAARELGQKWKVSPCINLDAQSTTVLADITGPGIIQHIWITVDPKAYRDCILRMYWDGESDPSVEVPLGDFFANGHAMRCTINSLPIAVNPTGGFNSYFPMPFRNHAKITIENQRPEEIRSFFYQIDYSLTDVSDQAAYFHAQWRRTNPLPYKTDYTILDDVKGKGHYVGTYMAWGQNNNGWWGEGEIKFFIDGDAEFPTICGTGTEDYFGGAWCFGETFSTPYLGYPLWHKVSGELIRHGLYRWHIQDPIRFKQDLKVTMQALGWRSEGRYLPLQDDIASVAYWYQTEPHATFPKILDRDAREVI
jgi:hypothetical protein